MQQSEAVALLKNEGYTLLIYGENKSISSRERGVAPLLALFDKKINLSSYAAVDRVVGKAAAFLYIALGIKEIYALTVSESARSLLEEHGACIVYETLVPRILNRSGNGFCPMESAVLEESDPFRALESIRKTRERLAAK